MKVNEIFYSIQGEGRHAGRAAVFIRLSGCNLKCPFCDTDFSQSKEMTVEEIVKEVCSLSDDCDFVVITGGEPTLQNCEPLIGDLHANGYYVAMESNGTKLAPVNVDWLTISPKSFYVNIKASQVVQPQCNELKVVYDGKVNPKVYNFIEADYYYLQPCDTGFLKPNQEIITKCVEFIKENPQWRLSLQAQKILKVR